MEPEFVKWLRENRPDWYEEYLEQITHDIRWRNNLLAELQAENAKLKALLADWLSYIDSDEIIQPPIEKTREVFNA
jgi:hypothetical protein